MARFGARARTGEQLDRVLNPIHSAPEMLDHLVIMRRGFFKVLKSMKVNKISYLLHSELRCG